MKPLVIPIGYSALYTIGPLWCIFALAVSCAVEILYLRGFSHQSFTWGWAVVGNAISSSVLMILPPIAMAIREYNRQLAWSLKPHGAWMAWSALGVSVALFLVSFALPVAARIGTVSPDSAVPASTEAGAESEPVEMETEKAV